MLESLGRAKSRSLGDENVCTTALWAAHGVRKPRVVAGGFDGLDSRLKMTPLMLMQAAVAQAKSQLADLLRRVERGEDVVIVRHGLPVARLVAIRSVGPPPVSATPLDPKLYTGIDLDEPAFDSWEKDGDARLD